MMEGDHHLKSFINNETAEIEYNSLICDESINQIWVNVVIIRVDNINLIH